MPIHPPNLFGCALGKKETVARSGINVPVPSAVRRAGVAAMVLALGLSGASAAEAAGRAAPSHAVSATAKHKHPKKHSRKHRRKRHHHKSGPGSPKSRPGSPGGSRSITIDSAVDTATGIPDFIGGTSDQVDVKITVATSTPLTDAVLIYLTKGGCFQNLSDANQYTPQTNS